jgi:hypothetical protein
MIGAGGDFAIPLGALIVAGAAVLMTARTVRNKAGVDAVTELRSQSSELRAGQADHEKRLAACEEARDRLIDEQIRLMRRILFGEKEVEGE